MSNIFIDWGSTNFHAFLVRDGVVVDRREVAGHGILTPFGLARGEHFSGFLAEAVAPWLAAHGQAPILMCGAIGSREGWIETRYVEAPAGFAEMAAGVRRLTEDERGVLRDRPVAIVAGLAMEHPDGRHDVMRSEEVKGLGATTHLGLADALLAIPGTHCKWLEVRGGRIVGFHTVMTGDIFAVLSGHGSLAPLFRSAAGSGDGAADEAGFEAGLELAGRGGDLLLDLWQVRSRELHAAAPPANLPAFLSGILIGHELGQVRRLHPAAREIVLVCDAGPRRGFYRRGCARFGLAIGAEVDSETAVCVGLAMIRRELCDTIT